MINLIGVRILSWGGVWADLLNREIQKNLKDYGWVHYDLGNPKFFADGTVVRALNPGASNEVLADAQTRLNSKNSSASELLYRFNQYLLASDILLLDPQVLDTAIGQYLLMGAQPLKVPAWVVGVQNPTSPLSAAFVQGVWFPSHGPDLVKRIQRELADTKPPAFREES